MSLPSGVSARPLLPGARLFQGSRQGYVIAIISAMLLMLPGAVSYEELETMVKQQLAKANHG